MVRLLSSISLLLTGMLSSCAAIIPHTLMTPTVWQQGEAEVNASLGLHGISLQAAYAPADRTVLLASGHHWVQGGRWSWAGETGGGRQWIKTDGGSWGIYGGVGFGAAYSYDPAYFDGDDAPSGERVGYTYVFVQPTYILVRGRTSLGFAVRIQPLYLNRWETYDSRYITDSLGSYRQYYPINKAGRWILLLQPGINLKRQISQRVSISSSLSVYRPFRQDTAPTVLGLAAGIGVQVTLGRKSN